MQVEKQPIEKKYIHVDIIPFKELPPSEQDKDKILIDAINEILAD